MRALVLMGSGETAPTMVSTHREVAGRLGPAPVASLLDTPYGFQDNAEEISARAVGYFRRNVGLAVTPVGLRRPADADPLDVAMGVEAVRRSDWLFAGPGSPSYLARQWRGGPVVDALAERLRSGGALVFGSAAAAVLGCRAVPVYEIYKAGEDPFWLDGLDLLAGVGLDAVLVPHFDNAEGGTHDTRYCYLGERRLRLLESQLPERTWVLGIDEHTAAVLDLDAGIVAVRGRGGLTVRVRGAARVFPAGQDVTLAALTSTAAELAGAPAAPAAASAASPEPTLGAGVSPLLEATDRLARDFDAALDADDAVRAGSAAVELEQNVHAWSGDTEAGDLERARDRLRSMVARLARIADDGLHDHRDLVAPFVAALLAVRARAREQARFDEADEIRDRLGDGGVQVDDTPDGVRWRYRPAE